MLVNPVERSRDPPGTVPDIISGVWKPLIRIWKYPNRTYMLVIIVIYALIFFIFCFCSKNKWEHSLNSSNFHDFKAGPEFLQAAMLMQHKVEKILVCSTVLKACDMFTYVVQKNSHLFVINQKPQTRYSLISKCFLKKNQIFSQFLV